MALQKCTPLNLSRSKKELQPHGTPGFPCAGFLEFYTNKPCSNIPWHWHETIELIYIKEGTLTLQIPSHSFPMHPGDCAVIAPNILHYADTDTSVCLYSLVFHPLLITGSNDSDLSQKYIQPLVSCPAWKCFLFPSSAQDIREHAETAFEALRTDAFGYEFTTREHLSHILLKLYSEYQEQLQPVCASPDLNHLRIEKMLSYIQAHYQEPLQLKDIARSASIGERECLRCFQRILCQSPIQYLLNYRVTLAADMLLSDPLAGIAEISGRCGFDSPSYFSKIFRKFYNCTPKEYRACHTGQ